MVKKEEYIKRYGEAAWEKVLEQRRAYYEDHKEVENVRNKKWQEEHPEEAKANSARSSQEQHRKDGKYYDKHLIYDHTGLQGERNKVRYKHGKQWRPYKTIIAPDSQIHHEWIPDTPNYRGIALVEADQHMHGFVNPIAILEGEITLFTEEEVKR